MREVTNFFLFLVLINFSLQAQVTGFLEDFNDNVLTGWEVPVDQGTTYTLQEIDSTLKIAYNRTGESWEWDNFNFNAPFTDVSGNPFISIKVKSDISVELAIKPVDLGTEVAWLEVLLPNDNQWHSYGFEMDLASVSTIDTVYFYLDGGTTELNSGIVYFDDFAAGDSADVNATLELEILENAIIAATALHDNSVEGTDEGQFEPGSKVVLMDSINAAQQVLEMEGLTSEIIENAAWNLYDACVTFETGVHAISMNLVDSLATIETKYLYTNLDFLSEACLMFGMHDATGYGVGWTGDDDRSDVYDVCGSYPAVYSEDANKIGRDYDVQRSKYRQTAAYNRGGIITYCWHQYDPQGRGFYSSDVNNENIVSTILPGGQYHSFYKDKLKKLAFFFKSLRGEGGESIPVIFRPYHEHTGGWFWWGDGQCSTSEYNNIWQFTVQYLRDSLNVHNLLYAISPSLSHVDHDEDYFNIYPGDDYVDIFGIDEYFGETIYEGDKIQFQNGLRVIAQHAQDRDKLIALTEVGQEGLTTYDFFTDILLDVTKNDTIADKVVYAAVWRNANETHHFAPYPGHPSVPNFLDFYNDPYTIFESNIPDMYILNTTDTIPPQIINYPTELYVAFDTIVTIHVESNERAFLKFSLTDQFYEDMPFEFEEGQGTFDHAAYFTGEQGLTYTLYLRAMDYFGNVMQNSVSISFEIDTLQRPIHWHYTNYDFSEWTLAASPFLFDAGKNTSIPYSRTVYFRRSFNIEDASTISQLVALVQYDNGMVIYLNGHEVERIDMPNGEVIYDTWAYETGQNSATVTLNAEDIQYLVNGENILAVEMHQSMTDSTDLLFNMILISPEVLINYGDDWYYYSEGQSPPDQTIITGINSDNTVNIPEKLVLYNNYPNPFNPATNIKYSIPKAEKVQILIYDMLGRKIKSLVNSKKKAGFHTIKFDASNLASGVYFYQLKAGNILMTKKMLLMR